MHPPALWPIIGFSFCRAHEFSVLTQALAPSAITKVRWAKATALSLLA